MKSQAELILRQTNLMFDSNQDHQTDYQRRLETGINDQNNLIGELEDKLKKMLREKQTHAQSMDEQKQEIIKS